MRCCASFTRSAPKRCSSRSTRPTPAAIALYRRLRLPRGRQAPALLPVGRRRQDRRACHAPRSSLAKRARVLQHPGAARGQSTRHDRDDPGRLSRCSSSPSGAACLRRSSIVAVRTGLFSPTIIPRLWHRLVVRALGFRVTVHGSDAGQRPLLIASNHISWTDIIILSSLAEVCFIAKSEIAGWPIFGTLARLQRTDLRRARAQAEIRRAGERARQAAGGRRRHGAVRRGQHLATAI